MTELSPQAQAVLDAAFGKWMEIDDIDDDIPGKIAAAALRAVADQVVPKQVNPVGDSCDEARRDQWMRIRCKLLAIATELENQ